jgi:hypothetical protein
MVRQRCFFIESGALTYGVVTSDTLLVPFKRRVASLTKQMDIAFNKISKILITAWKGLANSYFFLNISVLS